MTKLVVRKENKKLDASKCGLIDDMLGNEFLGCFLFGNDPLLGVSIDVNHFKKTHAKIVYCPLSDIHKDEILKIITQYNKFDTEVPFCDP